MFIPKLITLSYFRGTARAFNFRLDYSHFKPSNLDVLYVADEYFSSKFIPFLRFFKKTFRFLKE
jgi:hypothetical protein